MGLPGMLLLGGNRRPKQVAHGSAQHQEHMWVLGRGAEQAGPKGRDARSDTRMVSGVSGAHASLRAAMQAGAQRLKHVRECSQSNPRESTQQAKQTTTVHRAHCMLVDESDSERSARAPDTSWARRSLNSLPARPTGQGVSQTQGQEHQQHKPAAAGATGRGGATKPGMGLGAPSKRTRMTVMLSCAMHMREGATPRRANTNPGRKVEAAVQQALADFLRTPSGLM